MKDKTNVCNCGNPLIWTFFIPYAEWFCWECKESLPMFNADTTDETKELKNKLRIDTKAFRLAANNYVTPRSYRVKGCKKCENHKEYHEQHLTKLQKEKHEIAKKLIFN